MRQSPAPTQASLGSQIRKAPNTSKVPWLCDALLLNAAAAAVHRASRPCLPTAMSSGAKEQDADAARRAKRTRFYRL